MLCGKTNDNSKDNKLLLLIVIITGFLHIKIYKKFIVKPSAVCYIGSIMKI